MSERIDTVLVAGLYDWAGVDVKASLAKTADKMRRILAITREE